MDRTPRFVTSGRSRVIRSARAPAALLLALVLHLGLCEPALAREVVIRPSDVRSTADLQAIIDSVGPRGVVWFTPSTTPYFVGDTKDSIRIDQPVSLRALGCRAPEACMPTLVGTAIDDKSIGFEVPPGVDVDGVVFEGLRFRRFDWVILLDGTRLTVDDVQGHIRNVLVQGCVFDGYGNRAIQVHGAVTGTRIVSNTFRGLRGSGDSVSFEWADTPAGHVRPDLSLVACNAFSGPPVHVQSLRASRTLILSNRITTKVSGANGGLGIVWGGYMGPLFGDCAKDEAAYDYGAVIGNRIVAVHDDAASGGPASGWVGIAAMGPDPAPRGLVVGNHVTGYKAGIALTMMASNMVVADNTIDSTFADIVVGNGPDTPTAVEPAGPVPFDSGSCGGPSSVNAVLANQTDNVLGAVDASGNVVVRRGGLNASQRARLARMLGRLQQVASRRTQLEALCDDLYAVHGALLHLLREAR